MSKRSLVIGMHQNYEVPGDANLNKYKSVSIWCARFGVNFGFATLEPRTS